MAQDPLRPKDSGKIKMPRVDVGMNKLPPKTVEPALSEMAAAKGGTPPAKKDAKAKEPPPLSESGGPKKTDEEKVTAKEEAEVLTRIRKRMDRCIQAEADNRKAAVEDLKFKAGDQWPADTKAQRSIDKRPCLTVNKIPTFINQVTNDQRQNRPSINVSPVGARGDKEVAKMYRGLIRSIERECAADIAYDRAFESAVSCGFGYWRFLTEYEAPDSFDQVIVVRSIRNPFTVYLDPDHQEPDGADAKFGFITEMIPRDEFKEQWPEAEPTPFTQGGVGETFKNWADKDSVRIAEYFEIEHKERVLVALSNGHEGWEDELSPDVHELLGRGELKVVGKRVSHEKKVVWYKVTGLEILKKKPWAGKWIPIVKVIGQEIDLEGKVILSGLVRNAKDPQRMVNYWETSYTELVALAPKAPWIMEEGQVEGHEARWKQANVKNYPYLLYKGTALAGKPAPTPQRQPFAGVPAGIQQAIQNSAQNMMATTGIRFDSTQAERTMDESGKALESLRRSTDLGSFHYIDNLARSLRHAGNIFIDLIPKIYDKKRMLTILREDDTEERVQIDPNAAKPMQEQQDPKTGKTLKIFNPTYGKYGVTVTIGPSFASKRIEASANMISFAKALPNVASLIADLIAKNQDWPGAEQIAARLAKAVPPNLLTPEQKDMPPQAQALLQALDGQVKQLTQEKQLMMKELTDKVKDRALMQDKVDKDFEAKLLAVVQKAEAEHAKAIGAHLSDLGVGVKELIKVLSTPPKTNGEAKVAPPKPLPTPKPDIYDFQVKRGQGGLIQTITAEPRSRPADAPGAK